VFVTQALRSWLTAADRVGLLPAAILSDDKLIVSAIMTLKDCLADSWTIAKMASEVGLSRSAFTMRFRQVLGESPMRFLTRMRLSTAAGLLTTTRLSVQEIAFATGDENDSSLSKAFGREFG